MSRQKTGKKGGKSKDSDENGWRSINREMAAMNLAVSDQIREITKRLNNTNEELQKQVSDNHGSLLQQVIHANRFETALADLAKDVEQINTAGFKLNKQVEQQFEIYGQQSLLLKHLYQLSHLLRSSKTILVLTSKLKQTKDVLKQAEIHYELNELVENPIISRIEFLQDARSFVRTCRRRTINLTQMQLVTGLQEHSETSIVQAIKVC